MKIAVSLESMGLNFRSGLPVASRLGLSGVQLDATLDFAPSKLASSAIRDIRNQLKTYNLEIAALNCPLRRGIDVAEDQQPRLDYIRQVMHLAFELGPRLVVVQCPKLPANPEAGSFALLRDAMVALGSEGDRTGVRIGLEIGFDDAPAVDAYLNSFDYGSLGVAYDPSNMLLHGYDPVKSLFVLHKRLSLVYARDVRSATVGSLSSEVPLGAGNIDWMSFLGTLAAVDYRSTVVIRRERGAASETEVANGRDLLRRFQL
jgi:L-ribulose-5-phosphate 3-epimerase